MEKAEKTRKNYRSAKNVLLRSLGNIPVELIGDEQIAIWKQRMREEGMTQTTQRGYIISFQAILKYFRKRDYKFIDPYDITLPKSDTAPRPFISPADVKALVAAARTKRDKAIIACLFITGCRVSELLNLDRNQLDTPINPNGLQEIGVIGKFKKYRPVYLNADARYYLNDYLETRRDLFKPVFLSGQNRRITVSRVEQIVHECTREAQLETHVTPHILRHSFGSDLLINDASLFEVSKLMGHKSYHTTANIYGHLDTRARQNSLVAHQSSIY